MCASKFKVITSSLIVCLLIIIGVSVFGSPSVSALGTTYYPYTTAGNIDCDVVPCNSRVTPALAESKYGQGNELQVTAYYTSQTGQLVLKNANYCPSQSGNPDKILGDDYYDRFPGQLADGTKVTKFTITYPGKTITMYGTYYKTPSAACSADMTATMTGMVVDADTGLFYASVSVEPIDVKPGSCSPGNTDFCDGLLNFFSLQQTSANAFAITQNGDKNDGLGHKVTVKESPEAGDPDYVSLKIRFGSDCSVNGTDKYNLTYYDMDNDIGSNAQGSKQVKMSLLDETTGQTLGTWIPASGQNTTGKQPFNFVPQPKHKYIWTMTDVYKNNTVQFGTPFDGIFYLKQCGSPSTTTPPPPPPPPVQPYVQVTGGDALAGASIGTNTKPCATGPAEHITKAGIASWNTSTGTFDGAGASYAVRAWNYIQEFSSADGKGVADAPTRLSFSNVNVGNSVNPASGFFGGLFASAPCVDYWDAKPTWSSITNFSGTSVTGLNAVNKYDKSLNVGSGLTLNASTIDAGNHGTLYVDGNVSITGNIAYSSAAWSTRQNIPSFRLIVHGSIFIAPGVTQLDGLYVAIPDANYAKTKAQDASAERDFSDAADKPGIITTCSLTGAGSFKSYDPNDFLTNPIQSACSQALTVNGSFIANQVWLLRARGDVASTPAEIFNYSVDTWLGASSNLRVDGGSYQSIRGLPPVL